MYDFTKEETYTFQNFYIPTRMMKDLQLYIENHIPPGDFLASVITNDLKNAVGFADDENMTNLPAYVYFLYNEAPLTCWGSLEKFNQWTEEK